MTEVRFPPVQIPRVGGASCGCASRSHEGHGECSCHKEAGGDAEDEPLLRFARAHVQTNAGGDVGLRLGDGGELVRWISAKDMKRFAELLRPPSRARRSTSSGQSSGHEYNQDFSGGIKPTGLQDSDPEPGPGPHEPDEEPSGSPGSPPSPIRCGRPRSFHPKCSPDYKSVPFRYSYNCVAYVDYIDVCHWRAYIMAKTAQRTARYIELLDVNNDYTTAQLMWNWGIPSKSCDATYWGGSASARFAGLGYWFGPYVSNNIKKIASIFKKLVQWFEEGGVNWWWNIGWDSRKHVKYRCPIALAAAAMHPDQRHTDLGPKFFHFDVGHSTEIRTRVGASRILHESMHNIYYKDDPNDEKEGFCTGSYNKCYANGGDRYNDPYRHGDTWNSPRALVEEGLIGKAIDNIDNYVSWALRRWDDPQFGPCDRPRMLWE